MHISNYKFDFHIYIKYIMTIFDKDSEIKRDLNPGNSVIKGVYNFSFDDEKANPILKMYNVEIEKDQIIDEHYHDLDILTIVNYGTLL
jgi:quercetin dioxygenase-like cupin family protein